METDKVETDKVETDAIRNIKKEIPKKQVIDSKYLSYLLRHHPEAAALDMDEHGWVSIAQLEENTKGRYTLAYLKEIAANDSKKRYAFNEDETKIRANQGHSIPVDVELEEKTPPDILWHGTGEKYVSSIDDQGLIPKGRLYVHLSSDIETARKVGSRHGKPVLYEIDCRKMAEDGYTFYLSANHIWLTKSVPAAYLKKL